MDHRVDLLEHVRADPAGADGVDGDGRAERQGERLGHPVEARLGGDVLGEAHRRRVIQARVRGHVDDGPAALLQHHRHDRSGASPGSREVDRHRPLPVLIGRLEEGLRDVDPRVVDQHVDAPEGVLRGPRQGRGARRRGHVRTTRDRATPARHDAIGDPLRRGRLGAIHDEHRGALRCEPLRDGSPDAP